MCLTLLILIKRYVNVEFLKENCKKSHFQNFCRMYFGFDISKRFFWLITCCFKNNYVIGVDGWEKFIYSVVYVFMIYWILRESPFILISFRMVSKIYKFT